MTVTGNGITATNVKLVNAWQTLGSKSKCSNCCRNLELEVNNLWSGCHALSNYWWIFEELGVMTTSHSHE